MLPRPKSWLPWLPLLSLAAVGLFFLLNCSGLHFPIWNPKGRLNDRLTKDAGLLLPVEAKVTHGIREAYRDPSEYYVIEMSVADAAAFMAEVRVVGQELTGTQADPKAGTISIPEWWTPQVLPGVRALEFHRNGAFYRWFYSDTSGAVYLARLQT